VGLRDGQFVFCNANCEFLSAEIERIHPVRVPSSAHLIPLDGIEDDDVVLFAGDGVSYETSAAGLPICP
jgi:hypothetical protein